MTIQAAQRDSDEFRLYSMRRLYLAVVASLLLLSLSACGGQQTGGARTPSPPSPSASPPTPEPVQDRVPVPPGEVDASRLPRGFPRSVWTQDGGTVVVLTVPQGGCVKTTPELSSQDVHQVTITLVSQRKSSPEMCPMFVQYVPEAIRLAAPLRQRRVVLLDRDVKAPG
jgi:hypothetical protein